MTMTRRTAAARLLAALLAPTATRLGTGTVLGQQATPGPANVVKAIDAPVPIVFPRDDGPHDTSIEWWYYTGHLTAPDGRLFGFEDVVFRGRWQGQEGVAAHFAVTDNATGTFRHAERMQGIRGVVGDRAALDLAIGDWAMLGEDGRDRLRASTDGYAIDLELTSTKPAALHDGDGYIAYGDGTASYYYSRTRMDVVGHLLAGEESLPVTGTAWMDHQWGDFTVYKDGGWDWYAVQLDDGREIMLYLIRDKAGKDLLVDGSVVARDGTLTSLGAGDFAVTPHGTWTSPATGVRYPSGWTVEIPSERLRLAIEPTMPNQELDTRRTTGVIYWEGEATVSGIADGREVDGLAYVELTGYAPFQPIDVPTAATPVA